MANVVLNIGNQQENEEQLEKYVDLDMNAVYKTFAHKADAKMAAFTEEQDRSIDGQIWTEKAPLSALALDKKFKPSIDIDYSGYKIARNINVKAVQQSIHNIFTWMIGERIINPEFGSNLRKYLYEGITHETEELITAEIRQCIAKWEPRAYIVSIKNIGTTNDTENNTMHLQIVYTIPSLSDKQYSYSYYYNKVL